MTTETLNDVANDTAVEEVVSLADFAAPVSGAWPKGWYDAEVIEGYSTPKGKVFETGDAPSKNGDSRNATFCFKVKNAKGEERTIQTLFNYRESDFSADRIAFIKQARIDNASTKGKWADGDAQRTSLALAKIGQLENAIGTVRVGRQLTPAKAVGQKLQVRLTENEDGFNEINAFDKPATHTLAKA